MEFWLEQFNTPPITIGLFVASVVLVLVDYLFPTDWPCHVGYFCFACGMFLTLPLLPMTSMIAALVIWIVLIVLHMLFFRTILENANDDEDSEHGSVMAD